jgi:hypothetical protein
MAIAAVLAGEALGLAGIAVVFWPAALIVAGVQLVVFGLFGASA